MRTFSDLGIHITATSGEVYLTCPRCSSQRKKKKAKCLSVNVDEGVWVCHHCGRTGTLKRGWSDEPNELYIHWQRPTYRKPEPKPLTDLPETVVKFFSERGISEKTLKRNRIGYSKVYMPQIEAIATAIEFPYYRGEELVNIKYRDAKKNFRLETGAERILYGLNDIGKNLYLVEGEMDKLAIEEAGFLSCVSVPNGAPSVKSANYSSQFEFLEADKDKLEGVKQFILAVDNDEPGKKLEDELSRRLGKEKCLRVTWPEDCKDANETLLAHGKDILRDCLIHASPYPLVGVYDAFDFATEVADLYKNGLNPGFSTGWHSLDEFYTVNPGEFTVVTGIPGSGKSNLIDAIMVNMAKQHGWNFGIFSPENQPLDRHISDFIEKWAEIPFHKGPTQRMNELSRIQGLGWVHEHFSWIMPDDDTEWTIDNILGSAKSLVFRKGINGLVIDPWNELEHIRPQWMTETEYVSSVLKKIRQFARKYKVHIWLVAHPTKLYRDKNGKYPIPTPYDISGSAHFRNKADNCLTIWRDFEDDCAVIEVHVQKIRFRHIGKIGVMELKYYKPCATYSDFRGGI